MGKDWVLKRLSCVNFTIAAYARPTAFCRLKTVGLREWLRQPESGVLKLPFNGY